MIVTEARTSQGHWLMNALKSLTCSREQKESRPMEAVTKPRSKVYTRPEEGWVPREQALARPIVYRRTMLVTASIFMGYATLVTLQHRLKAEHDKVSHPPDDAQFKYASQLNYVGNLIFRLAHNFIFAFFTPRQRVHLSLGCMAAATGILGIAICIVRSPWIGWVPIAYLLGGVAVGTHESNLLATITPLGHATKKWAILGLPLGFTFISVGGYLLLLAGVPLVTLYLLNALMCGVSVLVFLTIPEDAVSDLGNRLDEVDDDNLKSRGQGTSAALAPAPAAAPSLAAAPRTHYERFRSDLREWRSWLPQIMPHAFALLLNMYAVSFMTAIMLYILDDDRPGGQVALLGPNTVVLLVPHDAFFAVYNLCIYFGDSLSRQMVYKAEKLSPPLYYLYYSLLGVALGLCKIPLLAPVGLFCVFYANGSIYATSTKHIDSKVDRAFNLTALSIWLFIGDFGSVLGSNTWQRVAPLVCEGVDAPHMCLLD